MMVHNFITSRTAKCLSLAVLERITKLPNLIPAKLSGYIMYRYWLYTTSIGIPLMLTFLPWCWNCVGERVKLKGLISTSHTDEFNSFLAIQHDCRRYRVVRNFRGRKLLQISWFCVYSWKFSPWKSTATPTPKWWCQAIHESFLREFLILHQFVKVFFLESFLLYGTCQY